MQYWGKIIGVAVALLMGGGFWGVVLGLLVGHMFDKARSRKMAWFANQRERQALFFATTFEVMGHLTKSKGRVTEADIHVANVLMDRMNLHGESRSAAQNAFRIGKSDNYPLREKMRQFRSVCFGRFDLIRMFLEIQIQAAFADGSLHPNEREVLYVIAEELGISRTQFDQFLRMMQGEPSLAVVISSSPAAVAGSRRNAARRWRTPATSSGLNLPTMRLPLNVLIVSR